MCSPSTSFVSDIPLHKLIPDSRARQTEKKSNTGKTARLSEELFGMLSAEGAKPDDEAVMEKIEELEVRAIPHSPSGLPNDSSLGSVAVFGRFGHFSS